MTIQTIQHNPDEEKPDDVVSRASKHSLLSVMSKQLTSISQAGLSKLSNKSYIFSLHKELEEEKRAR